MDPIRIEMQTECLKLNSIADGIFKMSFSKCDIHCSHHSTVQVSLYLLLLLMGNERWRSYFKKNMSPLSIVYTLNFMTVNIHSVCSNLYLLIDLK